MRIDAHQHYWRLARNDYHWMPTDAPLHRDWMPADLAPLNQQAGIVGTVAVQAAQTGAETDFLLELAGQPANSIMAVVGWIDLDADTAPAEIERLSNNPKLRAVRPMLQDLHDPAWILRPRVLRNLKLLSTAGLAYEVLSYPGHLPYVLEAIEVIPDTPVIIDHLSKPLYTTPPPQFWRDWIARFAERDNTAIKLSGMVTELPRTVTGPSETVAGTGPGRASQACKANADFVIEKFGPGRTMFGSDWPVCLQAADHSEVVGLAETLVSELSPTEQDAIWRRTAATFYRLNGADTVINDGAEQ